MCSFFLKRAVPALRRAAASRWLAALALASLAFTVAFSASAKFLGTDGETFPIAEEDVRVYLKRMMDEKIASGEYARTEKQWREGILNQLHNPPPVGGVVRTAQPRTRYYDPTYTVPQDVRDHEGKVLVRAGTRISPADYVALDKQMLFFDARDPDQVAYAKRVIDQQKGRVVPILVGGSYGDLKRKWDVHVYYDQYGALVRQLGISQVPALVRQEGARLRIDEVKP